LYNIKDLIGIQKITCTALVNYIICDKNFISNIMELNINETKLGCNIIPNQYNNYYGQFIDYLVRYEIAKKHNISFSDDRSKYIIMHGSKKEEFDVYHNIIKVSYNNMINKNASICDIFNVSLCHSIFFGDTDVYKMINTINNYDIISYNNIIKYINNMQFNNIILNPILNNYDLGIIGDGDLIMDNTIIDIKVSNNIGLHIYDFIQLIIYAIIYYKNTNIICNRLVICNFLKGNEYIINIDETLIIKLCNIVKEYNIVN